MNHEISGGGSADQMDEGHLDAQWTSLVQALEDQLSRMGSTGDHLVIELPPGIDGGCTPYAQFAGAGDDRVRAELSGNAHLAAPYHLDDEWCDFLRLMGWGGNDAVEPNWFLDQPRTQASTVAAMVVAALRESFGVAHPHLLTYRAWGPAAPSAADLGLAASPDDLDETGSGPSPAPMVLEPGSREELIEMIRCALEVRFEHAPALDSDGDVVLTHLGQPAWVRVLPEQPWIEIFTQVTHGVRSRRATAVELAVLNRTHPFVKWTLRDRSVWQHLMLPGLPFAFAHLDTMLDLFGQVLLATRDDLALRVGGRSTR